MKGCLTFVVVILIVLFILGKFTEHEASAVPFDNKYQYAWKSPEGEQFTTIGRALVKYNIRGCGEYYLRESIENDGEYLVACTRDGDTWRYYLVWDQIGKVMGPLSEKVRPPR